MVQLVPACWGMCSQLKSVAQLLITFLYDILFRLENLLLTCWGVLWIIKLYLEGGPLLRRSDCFINPSLPKSLFLSVYY